MSKKDPDLGEYLQTIGMTELFFGLFFEFEGSESMCPSENIRVSFEKVSIFCYCKTTNFLIQLGLLSFGLLMLGTLGSILESKYQYPCIINEPVFHIFANASTRPWPAAGRAGSFAWL